MSEPELSPLEDLGLPNEEGESDLPELGAGPEMPDLDSGLGPDALDEAIAELQGVIDKDDELGPLDEPSGGEASPAAGSGLQELVMSIPVQIDVVIGSAEMPVSELMSMEAGSVVTLNRMIGEAVDICVNNTKIATGEIQSLEDDPTRLGVKIISLEKS